MDDSKQRPREVELLLVPQEALGNGGASDIHEVRRIWDVSEQVWYYSIVDFVRFLTGSKNAAAYWSTLKKRDTSLEETLRKIKLFPLRAKDGRLREAECVTRETMFRIIQAIPSPAPLVEATKQWLAELAEEKIQELEIQTQVEQLRAYYIEQQGRTPEWAEARIRNLIGRNALTDEWLARGAQQHLHFSILTTTIHQGTFGVTTAEHHQRIKRLPKRVKQPRDHYTEAELGVLSLAELAARQRHQEMESQGFAQLLRDAEVAGKFGEQVRLGFEEITGKPVVSSENFLEQPKGKGKKKALPKAEQRSLFEETNKEQAPPDE